MIYSRRNNIHCIETKKGPIDIGILLEKFTANHVTKNHYKHLVFSHNSLWENIQNCWEKTRGDERDDLRERSKHLWDQPFDVPIEQPPLIFGLAGNCPQTWRNSGKIIQNYPVGYTRTYHTLTPHLGRVKIPKEITSFRCAAELGVIIARDCRNVSRADSMDYVAGYTIVNDMISNHWKNFAVNNSLDGTPSFEELLITSYYGRGTEGFCPCGPYIVSKDEIQDPYNLMVYTYINDELLDRSHTNAMVIGIEESIAYLSKFMKLKAGSIIHMGTMGVDGITISGQRKLNTEDNVRMNIESIGTLTTYFQDERKVS